MEVKNVLDHEVWVLSSFKHKQAIVVRTDLAMTKGKTAVQVAHAAVTAGEKARREHKVWWEAWIGEGQCKVTVMAKSESELLELEKEAGALGLPTALIEDRGLTEIPPGTITCLGIGPAPAELLDRVTGRLPLL